MKVVVIGSPRALSLRRLDNLAHYNGIDKRHESTRMIMYIVTMRADAIRPEGRLKGRP